MDTSALCSRKRSLVSYSLVPFTLVLGLVLLPGCANRHWQDTQTQLQQLRADQQQDLQQQSQQQSELNATLAQLQAQLAEQQKMLEEKPRVIEKRTTRIVCPSPAAAPAPKLPPAETPVLDKLVVGLREQVLLPGIDLVVPARINTSVANSVLDARNIQVFERNGEEWVRFTVYDPETKEPHVLERKRLRFQNVTTAVSANEKRPVVEMRFTIGKMTQKGEFILADRSDSEYPLLVGRNILRDIMLVDVSGKNLVPLQRTEEASASSSSASPAQP